ncbi:MAG: LuxR C-terminal-related transcriptional regulator [Candidatus Moduliflexus flocculans]|nr:LuxR C-terminal-related transcriptional regulator [Candidatus Moduliflexus flocculans]
MDGLTYRELAERHHIAGSTAKKHILHIYQKLNVSSKAEIVRKALDERLV